MAIVNGDGVLISFFDGDEAYIPFACYRSVTINLLSDIVGKSTIGSGDWKEKEVVALDWNCNCEGIPHFLEPNRFDTAFLINLWLSKTPISIITSITANDGITYVALTGNALITDVSINGAVNNVASVSFTAEGTGELNSSTWFEITSVVIHADPINEYDITFNFGTYPFATDYTIEINDLTDDTTTTDVGGAAPRTIEALPSSHYYSFRLKNDITNTYGPYIYYPS